MNEHQHSAYFRQRRNAPDRPTAAALFYDPVDATKAPEVVAAGRGIAAEEIVALAREHDVPIHQDALLVAALATLDLGTMIPRELYAVVAEVLAFVYAVDAGAS